MKTIDFLLLCFAIAFLFHTQVAPELVELVHPKKQKQGDTIVVDTIVTDSLEIWESLE